MQNFLGKISALKKNIGTESLGRMIQQFNDYFKQQLSIIDCYNPFELNEVIEAKNVVKLNGFCLVFHEVCGQVESSSIKQLLHFNGKFYGIMLCGNVAWLWHTFWTRNAISLLKPYEKNILDAKKQRNIFLQSGNFNFTRETRNYCLKIISWTLKMNVVFSNCNDIRIKEKYETQHLTKLKNCVKLLLQIIQLMGTISFLIKAVISSHEILQIPVTKENLKSICKLIELVQTVGDYLQEREKEMYKLTHSILQYFKYLVLHSINNCKVNYYNVIEILATN